MGLLSITAALAMATCGGNVVVDTPSKGTGAGSQGGATTTTSTVDGMSTGDVFPGTNDATSTGDVAPPDTNDATTSTSTGGDPCATGADCSQCPDQSTCTQCLSQDHPAGVPLYQALVTCILCTDCYTSCQVAGSGECAGPPATLSGCEAPTPGMNACNACQQCSINGQCKQAVADCENSPDCMALLMPNCPQN